MLEPEPTWGDYDASLYIDWGQDCDIFKSLPEFTPNPSKPSVCWQSDTHWQPGALEYRFGQAVKYRTAAFCQKGAADLFATALNAIALAYGDRGSVAYDFGAEPFVEVRPQGTE